MNRAVRYTIPMCLVLFVGEALSQPTQVVNAFPNLTFVEPVFLTHANDGSNRIFVVEQDGRIRVFPNDSTVTSARTFLNVFSRIITGGERGLLGLAFHPNYATNGYFYVNYTQAVTGRTIVARYSVNPANPDTALFNSELILLNIFHPFSNHNGGMVMFGLDGYLYIGTGDGGSGCDPGNRAQNLDSLLGKILRVDVDTATPTTNYGIPPDNPLVGTGYREEIYAWGMRNPWRFSQDPVTGETWVADVGQSAWEEINLLENGGNYGWRNFEGFQCGTCSGAICDTTGLEFPVKVYSHSLGCSVTGGYIYRGYRRPDLAGRYIYGDYCSGRIWQFRYVGGVLTSDSLLVTAPFPISSFGVDQDGELYICNHSGNIQRFVGNSIYVNTSQVAPTNGSQNVPIPATLRWRQAAGAIRYWLEVATDPGFASVVVRDTTLVDTSYTISILNEGTQYHWRVKVRNGAGWGNFSSVWNFRTGYTPAQVNLVEPPNGSNVPSRIVTFRWGSAANSVAYWLELGFDSTFATVVRQDTALVDTALTIIDATRDTAYYWRVRGRGAAGDGPFSEVWRFTTYNLPAQVNLVSPPDSSTVVLVDSVDFLWQAVASANDYWFEVARDQGFSDIVAQDTLVLDTAKTVGGLSRPQRYYWRVRARSGVGYGPFSDPWTFFYDFDLGVGGNKDLPKRFALYQNHPNPFNPATRIAYDLSKESSVRLSISNVLGQEMGLLYEGLQQPGSYSVVFDASSLSSGIYFYRLEAHPLDGGSDEGFRSVRKMLLMK